MENNLENIISNENYLNNINEINQLNLDLFDDMFAMRIVLENEFNSEINIIKELKKYLLELRINRNEINNIIFNFYKHYGINVELNVIEEIEIFPFNIFNQLLRNHNSERIEFINIFSEMLSNNNSELQDVILTVDEKDLQQLKKIILDKKLDCDCSICMGNMNINDEIIELNCCHKYHSDCILKYFKAYNNKCPICRIEIGNAKYIF
jgi:hypothetical protein|uniref:RING-type domain-containing protein n=1 Tax=viral metagenome TaxID=1070528 RepID=A0A6C0EIK2_9ZZZZ